jgi:hypothetical protein
MPTRSGSAGCSREFKRKAGEFASKQVEAAEMVASKIGKLKVDG